MDRRIRTAALVCLAGLVTSPALATLEPEPPAPKPAAPATNTPPPTAPPKKPEELLRELEQSRKPKPSIKPTLPGTVAPGLPGAVRPNGAVNAGRLVRQGTFLVMRRGTVHKSPEGEVTFVFDPDAEGAAEAPMQLMPNSHLQNLERISDRADPTARFNISGQVMAFKGHNYLLMDRPAEIVRAATTKPTDAKPADASTPAPTTADPAGMINKLEGTARDRDTTRPILAGGPATGTGPGTPTVSPEKLIREGTSVISKRGRMIRQPNGDWALTFDADASGKSEPPLLLLPCMNLQAMERIAERGGEAATMSVSGIVTTYKSRNYLVPTMYVINRPSDIVPGQ